MTNNNRDRLREQERLILEATETICRLMREQDVSKADLARRLGTSRAFVTQILNGTRNLTLRTLADVVSALDHRVRCHVVPTSIATGVAGYVVPAASGMWVRPSTPDAMGLGYGDGRVPGQGLKAFAQRRNASRVTREQHSPIVATDQLVG